MFVTLLVGIILLGFGHRKYDHEHNNAGLPEFKSCAAAL
jgi:hypothetical protein